MREIAGTHLIMDGFVQDASRLEPDALICLFNALVGELGMQYLHNPCVSRVPTEPTRLDSEEDEGGWSAFAQITTSHIALHGWPLRKAFMMDIFSCKPFDAERAKHLVWDLLGVTEAVHTVLARKGPLTGPDS